MITELITNKIVISVTAATIICQIWKVLHKLIWEKKLDAGLFFATGGMPSSHSTFVAALATSIGFKEGWTSTIFLLSLGFAAIVIRDAFGVRKTVDDLIRTVNNIIRHKQLKFDIIKKIAGHTPVQTITGTVLGITVAAIINMLW